ncbi:MurR/RpiR family transcriptional regulator [Enterocloster alcoholdehydrogenati]|uniref:MurR/RpiR family transcriptional regulator n=1 Tax=Enterocloster alcoholdehydrogenati TaxID=2547410 RepID=A0ABQ0ATR6_9FIRM
MNLDLNKLTCTASLTDTERAVLEFLLTHIDEALKLGVRGVAKANFTSTSTVMRLSRKLGYNGFIEMYYKLLGAAGKGTPVYELNEGFLSHFAGDGNVSMENYRSLRLAAQRIHKTDQMVFIYGMGFSSMMAEYLAKKLLVLGIKCIFSDGADSIGVFENNLEDIGCFIAFSRSGRSPYVLNRVKMAEENSVFTMGFTNDGASPLKEYCSCVIEVPDDNPLDDRNMKPTLFFSKTITMIELLIYEYYQISIG